VTGPLIETKLATRAEICTQTDTVIYRCASSPLKYASIWFGLRTLFTWLHHGKFCAILNFRDNIQDLQVRAHSTYASLPLNPNHFPPCVDVVLNPFFVFYFRLGWPNPIQIQLHTSICTTEHPACKTIVACRKESTGLFLCIPVFFFLSVP